MRALIKSVRDTTKVSPGKSMLEVVLERVHSRINDPERMFSDLNRRMYDLNGNVRHFALQNR